MTITKSLLKAQFYLTTILSIFLCSHPSNATIVTYKSLEYCVPIPEACVKVGDSPESCTPAQNWCFSIVIPDVNIEYIEEQINKSIEKVDESISRSINLIQSQVAGLNNINYDEFIIIDPINFPPLLEEVKKQALKEGNDFEKNYSMRKAVAKRKDKILSDIKASIDKGKISLDRYVLKMENKEKEVSNKLKNCEKDLFKKLDYDSSQYDLTNEFAQLEQELNQAQPQSAEQSIAKDLGFTFINHGRGSLSAGDIEAAIAFKRYTEGMLDIVIGIDPITAPIRDVYEAFTGNNLITGEKLEVWERGIAVFGAVTFGFGSKIGKGIKLLSKMNGLEKVSDIAQKIGVRTKEGLERFFKFSKQVPFAKKDYEKVVNKIADASQNVTPKFGSKYVRELPDLKDSYKEAFEGHIFKGIYEPGEILFQAQRTGQKKPGRWFSPIKPIDRQHAEEMLNIAKYSNDAGQLKAFVVKERVSGYAGKIEGGVGHQFYVPDGIPLSEVLEEVKF